MSSAWLITRFIDPNARFGFAPDREAVPRDGVAFDMFGVEFSHHGEHCTFETLCARFGIDDAAVARVAEIVHDLDLKDGRFGAPEAAAIASVIDGLQLAHADDEALLAQGMTLFDALYRGFAQSMRKAGPRAVAGSRARRARRAFASRERGDQVEIDRGRRVEWSLAAITGPPSHGAAMTPVVAMHQHTVEDVDRAQRATVARLCAAAFLAYSSYAICRTPLLPLFARELGATAPTVGFVVAASTLTGIVLKLPAGTWSDVLGRRPLLVAGGLVFALLPFTYLGVASLGTLIALRFIHGAATAIFGPVASASLSDVAPAARRATWLSTYSTIQGAGQAVGPIVAGYLIAGGGFDRAFLAAGVIGLATPLIVSRWPQAGHARRRRRGSNTSGAASRRSCANA